MNRIAKLLFKMLGVNTPVFNIYLLLRELRFYYRCKSLGTFAQHGEDRFVLEYFQGKPGIYIDIGASHPFMISNTYLLYTHGWRGVTVEPIPYLHERHLKYRPRDISLNAALGSEPSRLTFYQMIPSVLSTFDENAAGELVRKGMVLRSRRDIQVMTLASLYQQTLAGKTVDLLSVDVEGLDLEVLEGNEWALLSPELVICEVNPGNAFEVDTYMSSVGYGVLQESGCNHIYRRMV